MNTKLTQDDFLGGKLKIIQPKKGFRAGSDTVFLAASISQKQKGKVLDVGCGVGTASLCLAYRNKNIKIDGIELHQEMLCLAQENAEKNGFQNQISFHKENILEKTNLLVPNSYDCVLTNPPYFEEKGTITDKARLSARIKKGFSINDWIKYCLKMLKPRGYINLIYPSSQLDQVIQALGKKVGEITLFPLWPRKEAESKRFIIIARKAVQSPSKLLQGVVLHDSEGKYTEQAQAILKEGKGLFD